MKKPKYVKIALTNGARKVEVITVTAPSVNVAMLRWQEAPAGREYMRKHGDKEGLVSVRYIGEVK